MADINDTNENLETLDTIRPLPVSRANPKIDADKAISMRLKGCTIDEIAKYFGVSYQAVSERLNRIMPNYAAINQAAFRKHKADILGFTQAKLITSLSSEKIKEMSGRDTVVSFGILHDKELELRGESPAQQGIAAITSLVDALKGYKSPPIDVTIEGEIDDSK